MQKEAKSGNSYCYILKCADGSLYTGWTNNLARRLADHQNGKASKYTRSRLPVELNYVELCPDKIAAMQREWQIKQLSRQAKLDLSTNQAVEDKMQLLADSSKCKYIENDDKDNKITENKECE